MKKIFYLCFVFAICLCFIGIKISAASTYYELAGKADSSSIELSTKELNKAKSNCEVKGKAFTNTATIDYEYEVHVYHFEAPSSGYFAFYTTGRSDTLIKVYEHQNFLWWTTRYKDNGIDDDSSKADKYIRNAYLALNCTKDEDYYICVRLYSSNTGNYNLIVEPNEDKLLSSKYDGTKWKCDKLTNSSILSGVWITEKQYLTKEEVILFYWSLDPACQKLVGYDLAYVYNAYNADIAKGIEIANFVVGILLSLGDAGTSVSIGASVLGTVLSYSYAASNTTCYEMMQKLVDLCGVEYDGSKWSATSGLVIKEAFISNSIPSTWYYYESFNDEVYVGDKYAKGIWE